MHMKNSDQMTTKNFITKPSRLHDPHTSNDASITCWPCSGHGKVSDGQNHAPPAYSTIKKDRKLIDSTDKLFNVMHSQFSSTGQAPNAINWDFIKSIPNQPTRDFPPISIHKLWSTLGKTSNTSAPGLDHLTWRHLKVLLSTPTCDKALVKLFNTIMTSSVWPQEFKEAVRLSSQNPQKTTTLFPKPTSQSLSSTLLVNCS